MKKEAKITCEISVADFLDRLSILYVKRDRIKDPQKLAYIQKEIEINESKLKDTNFSNVTEVLTELKDVNSKMWGCNERRKEKIQKKEFDDEYLQLTILESEENDRRFQIKSRFDKSIGSALQEQKSYPWLRY